MPTAALPDGRTLAYDDLGDAAGFPVVWNHGGLSSRADAAFLRDGLDGIRLLALDRPGIGDSSRRRGRTVADWPADVRVLVDQLGIDAFAVAGWSAGGPFALAIAAAFPERVPAVLTIGGMAPLRSSADARELGLRTDRVFMPLTRYAPWVASLSLKVSGYRKPDKLRAAGVKAFPAPDQRVLAPLSTDLVVGSFYAAVKHGTRGTVDDYRAFCGDWDFDLGSVQARVRCWQGDGDTLVPRAHAERLASTLPNAELVIVPDAGHFLFVEHAAEVFAGLKADVG